MKKKQAFTLIEIMIAIALIGMIGGILTYNLRGSLEKGKAFKTQEAKKQIKNILALAALEQNISLDEIVANWEQVLKQSPLVHEPDAIIKDGWNKKFDVAYHDGDIMIQSQNLQQYYRKHHITPDPEDEPRL